MTIEKHLPCGQKIPGWGIDSDIIPRFIGQTTRRIVPLGTVQPVRSPAQRPAVT
jgi:hypothetical protein